MLRVDPNISNRIWLHSDEPQQIGNPRRITFREPASEFWVVQRPASIDELERNEESEHATNEDESQPYWNQNTAKAREWYTWAHKPIVHLGCWTIEESCRLFTTAVTDKQDQFNVNDHRLQLIAPIPLFQWMKLQQLEPLYFSTRFAAEKLTD
ncbi:hypothetical protein CLF_104209 [Clonorchis sinensis]|uniref:Uncharacterized protein n=1 Tax=Clonorchis sinensis TaxID=79923 RepID=G7YNT5_CLOSI|nr:hypothetical protein CLF_104209 [Clonorchis sinensis]